MLRGVDAQVDRNVEREICNHRMLNHPNIVAFMEVRRPCLENSGEMWVTHSAVATTDRRSQLRRPNQAVQEPATPVDLGGSSSASASFSSSGAAKAQTQP